MRSALVNPTKVAGVMLLDALAGVLVGTGLVTGLIVAGAARAPREGLKVLLDFLLAAGLLRLMGPQSWATLTAAAVTIAVRQVAGRGLAAPGPLWSRARRAQPSGVGTSSS